MNSYNRIARIRQQQIKDESYLIRYTIDGKAFRIWRSTWDAVRRAFANVGQKAQYFIAFTPVFTYKRNGVNVSMRRQICGTGKRNR